MPHNVCSSEKAALLLLCPTAQLSFPHPITAHVLFHSFYLVLLHYNLSSAVRDFSEAPFYLQHVIQIGASDTFWKEERKKGGRSRREGKRHLGSSHSKAGHRCRTLMRCVLSLVCWSTWCITTDFSSKLLEGPVMFALEDPHLMFVSGGSFGTVRRKIHRWCQRGAGWAQTFTMVEGVGSSCFRGRKRLPAHFQEERWRGRGWMWVGLWVGLIWEAQLQRPEEFWWSLWRVGDILLEKITRLPWGTQFTFKVKPASLVLWWFCSSHDEGEWLSPSRSGFSSGYDGEAARDNSRDHLSMGVKCEAGPKWRARLVREPSTAVGCQRNELQDRMWNAAEDLKLSFQPFAVHCEDRIQGVAMHWVLGAYVLCCGSFMQLSFHFARHGSQIHLLEINIGNNVRTLEEQA